MSLLFRLTWFAIGCIINLIDIDPEGTKVHLTGSDQTGLFSTHAQGRALHFVGVLPQKRAYPHYCFQEVS